MVALLMLAAFGRQVMVEPRRFPRAVAQAVVGLGAAWLGLWQSGSLIVPSAAGLNVGGFGGYSANLLTFIMPTEANTGLFPGPFRYASPPQYEGYAYLGLGLLLLALGAIVGALVSRWRPAPGTLTRHVPLGLALIVLTALALGPTVTAGAQVLWSYDGRMWGPLTTFRSSGRMIWPLYYATVTAILCAVARVRHRAATFALAAALAVQAGDLSGMVPWIRTIGDYGCHDPLVSRVWTVAPRHYQRVVVVPSNLCAREGVLDLQPFLLLAGRERLAINAGATARYRPAPRGRVLHRARTRHRGWPARSRGALRHGPRPAAVACRRGRSGVRRGRRDWRVRVGRKLRAVAPRRSARTAVASPGTPFHPARRPARGQRRVKD